MSLVFLVLSWFSGFSFVHQDDTLRLNAYCYQTDATTVICHGNHS